MPKAEDIQKVGCGLTSLGCLLLALPIVLGIGYYLLALIFGWH